MSAIYFSETLLPDGAPATDLADNDWKGIFLSGYNPIIEGPLQRLQDGKAADDFTYAQWTPVGEPENNDDVLKTYYRFLGLFLETYHGETRVRMTILEGKTYHSDVATFSTAFPYARYELFLDVIEQLRPAQNHDGADQWEVDCDLRMEFPGSLLQKLSSGMILPEALDELTWTTRDVDQLDDSMETEAVQEGREGSVDTSQDESQDAEANAIDPMDVDELEQLDDGHTMHRNEAKRSATHPTVHSIEDVGGSGAVEYTGAHNIDARGSGKPNYGERIEFDPPHMPEIQVQLPIRGSSSQKRGWKGWTSTDQEVATPVGSGIARVNADNIIEGSRRRKGRF